MFSRDPGQHRRCPEDEMQENISWPLGSWQHNSVSLIFLERLGALWRLLKLQ